MLIDCYLRSCLINWQVNLQIPYLIFFQNYIFSLLTGYKDAPAGVMLAEGQHYNPYFPGGAISMAQALYNEIIEYEDGEYNEK